jgi:hypothetical protein
MPYRKHPPKSELREAQDLLYQALAAYDRETGRKPRAGDIGMPIDSRTGKAVPNSVIIRTNIQRVMSWLWMQQQPRRVAARLQRQLQFARWWHEIRGGKHLADILREEAPERMRVTLRKDFERWRRALGGAFRGP